MLAALLLLVDAEIARRAGLSVFQLAKITTENAGPGSVRIFPEAALVALDVMVWGLMVAVQVGLCWLVWRWAWKHKATRLAWILGLPDDDDEAASL